MDVVTAFLNGDLDKNIHMEQPEGFIAPENTDKVCRLRKALYGLKQANRQWYAKMDTFLCGELGFTRNAADHYFYVRIRGEQITLIALYVDDLLIACVDKTTLDAIEKALSMKFEMKGEAQKCLGLEIFRCRKDGILSVSQSEYAKMVFARYNMADVYGANTPMECGNDLHDTSELANDVPYRKAIGNLMYLMVGTRPDIAFTTSQLSNSWNRRQLCIGMRSKG
jgi:hypothetical protein